MENRSRRSGPGWRAASAVPIQQPKKGSVGFFAGGFRRCTGIYVAVYVIRMSLAIGMVYTAYQR